MSHHRITLDVELLGDHEPTFAAGYIVGVLSCGAGVLDVHEIPGPPETLDPVFIDLDAVPPLSERLTPGTTGDLVAIHPDGKVETFPGAVTVADPEVAHDGDVVAVTVDMNAQHRHLFVGDETHQVCACGEVNPDRRIMHTATVIDVPMMTDNGYAQTLAGGDQAAELSPAVGDVLAEAAATLAEAEGKELIECDEPGCRRRFATQHGLDVHKGRTHKDADPTFDPPTREPEKQAPGEPLDRLTQPRGDGACVCGHAARPDGKSDGHRNGAGACLDDRCDCPEFEPVAVIS